MPCEDCYNPCDPYQIIGRDVTPVALVCNLIPETDGPTDPLCLTCCGTMCFHQEGGDGGTEIWTNDYGAWQNPGTSPVVSTQLLSTGETINLTWNSFVAGQIVNSAISGGSLVSVFSSGGPTTRSFTLSWDVPLVGPFAFTLRNLTPASEDIPNIVPAPDLVTPAFGVGDVNTIHQVLYNDITGISQITIDFETIGVATGTVIAQMDASVPFQSALSAAETTTVEVMLIGNMCIDPPTMRYIDMATGDEVTDADALASLYNCDIDVTEELVCVGLDDETFTCIKRTFYASDPVDVFIGPNGSIINPDSWVPGICVVDTWSEILCDVADTVEALTLIVPDTAILENVNRIDGLTGAILETHTEPGVDWSNGSFYNSATQEYYIYNNNNSSWYRYDMNALSVGPTNLGPFAGDPIVDTLSFGTFDPSTGLGYVGRNTDTLYEINLALSTSTALPPLGTGFVGGETSVNSLTIFTAGRFVVVARETTNTRLYLLDIDTQIATFITLIPNNIRFNAMEYDLANDTGFYGVDSVTQTMYRWTALDASDIQVVGTPGTAPAAATMAVEAAAVSEEILSTFMRVYHKDTLTDEITTQDHLLTGTPYEVVGRVATCTEEVESIVTWAEILCDRQDTVVGLDVYTFDDGATQEVQKLDGLTGAVLEFHNPAPAIEWGHGTIFDASGGTEGYYYLYDVTAAEWHRYDASDITLGSTNLGSFAGDPIVGSLTFGAYDPTSSLGYVGNQATTRYRVDFNTSTVTSLAAITGAIGAPSSLSITEAGIHYITSWDGGGTVNRIYTVNPLTGVATFVSILPLVPSELLNGADYDLSTSSGFYGISGANLKLYRWTLPNGSDIQEVGDAPNTGTLAVGQAEIVTTRTEFQRVYHKENGVVSFQNHDLEGEDYEVVGIAETCPIDVEVPPIELCSVPAGTVVCYETFSAGPYTVPVLDPEIDWVIEETNILASKTFPLPDGTELRFEMTKEPTAVGIGAAVGANGPPMGSPLFLGGKEFYISWNKPFVGGQFTLSIFDIDGFDFANITSAPAPDSIGAAGDNIYTPYTWNDSTTLTSPITILGGRTDADGAGAMFIDIDSAALNLQVYSGAVYGQAFVSFDCDGLVTYRDVVTNAIVNNPVIVPCHVSNSALFLCDTNLETDEQTPFIRHINKDSVGDHHVSDTTMDGTTEYIVQGVIGQCHDCPCDEVIAAHLHDVTTGTTFTLADTPVNTQVTGLTFSVIVDAVDNSVTDSDGTVITNIPAGVTLSWNAEDVNGLSIPQTISSGTNGRILVNYTTRNI